MDAQIVKVLEGAGSLSTGELARAVGADHNRVYRRCRAMEKVGRLRSELTKVGGKRVFFFPLTGEAVSAANYDRVDEINEALVEIVRAHPLPGDRERLIDALAVQLERLAEGSEGARRDAIEEFAQELLELAATAQGGAEVKARLGIRPMRPAVRIWSLGGQLALI
jgi:DNA-binding Lrp family transcriptional regulator